MRSELHLVSPNDELSSRNGSAVLTVARALRDSAARHGVRSEIGGSVDRLGDLPHTVATFDRRKPGRALRIVDTAAKLTGRSITTPTLIAPSLAGYTHIYCHNLPWLAPELRAEVPEAKLVLYVHNRVVSRAPRSTVRRVLGGFDDVVCVSEYVRRDLVRRSGVVAPEVRTVYNGVDSARFGHKPEESPTTKFDMTFVGRVVPEKGAMEFAEAARIASASRPLSVALVGGRGFLPDELSSYERRVRQVLAHPNIRLTDTGPVPPAQIPAIMNESRVVVVPSVWNDPCPLVALEAMASRAALIATDVGGMSDLVSTGGGLFVVPGSGQAIADAVISLLADRTARERVATTGQAWASARPWSKVYEELLGVDG